jgi:hypothetical protein
MEVRKPAPIWRDGAGWETKRVLGHLGSARSAQPRAQLRVALLSLFCPALPPPTPPPPWELLAGVAAARLAARCAAGEGGPIGLTCGPVGRALVRAELGYPHAAPLDGLEVPRAVPANSYMITALRGCGDRAGILLAQITAITCGRVSTRVVQTCAVTSCSYACHRLSTTYTAPPPPHPPPWKSAAGVCECLAGRGHSLEGGVHTSRTYQSKGLIT